MMPLSIFSVNLLSENLLLLASLLVFAAVLVMKVGSRLGAPSLLLFLLLGMAVGADGLGLRFDDYKLAESIGHFAVTIIVFTAGLETSLSETKPVLRQGALLSTLGVLLTVLLTGCFIWLVTGKALGMPTAFCFLLAAVMVSTDSASVFSIIREKRLHLRENLGPMLELESGCNDPIAFSLTIIVVNFLTTEGSLESGPWHVALYGCLAILLQVVVGITVGLAVGYGAKWILERIHLPSSALSSILLLSIGFFANGISSYLHGNGLLALYIAAIIIGNKVKMEEWKENHNFFDALTWLMQLMMFLMLGLLARPSQMLPLIVPALVTGLFMMLFARPVSVLLCLLPFKNLSFRARSFVSWVGLKGAGPILFALCPVVAGLEHATTIFNIVFLITLFSLLVQGSSLGQVARLLNLSYEEDLKVETFGMDIPEEMGMLRDHTVTEDDLLGGDTLRDLHLPHGIRVVMVKRGERYLVPHGSMALIPGDRLVIIMGDSDD